MRLKKQMLFVCLLCVVSLSGCGNNGEKEMDNRKEIQAETQLDKINMAQWQYNEENDVYWQVGIAYCEDPADENYENLGVFVPGAYMTGSKNEDGTYTCKINASGTAGGYTAETAPIVIPVETPGYSAMAAPTGYVDKTVPYTEAGFVYVYAGCRGREAGAPAGVTDLKAAIRYLRYNGDTVPGSTDRIFSFGMSGGGAQSALLGSTGDSESYTPYLEAIGAVSGVSDAVAGSMCWCPITNLDYASEAYEWNLGVTRNGLEKDMQKLSDAMAEKFALYVNELKLKDEEGNTLVLEESKEGIYQAGSYYDYLKTVVETSLNHFLEDTTFPYTVESGHKGGFGNNMTDFPESPGKNTDDQGTRGGKGDVGDMEDLDGKTAGGKEGRNFDGPKDGEFPQKDGELPEKNNQGDNNDYYAVDGIERNETSGGISLSGTYETVQDYIKALNTEEKWVSYDKETNTATITSIADFVSALKIASKDVGAFDALDKSQGENILFGDGNGDGGHFDVVMAELLGDSDYGEEFAEDQNQKDALGTSVADRVNMYNPLYFLNEYYKGYQTAQVASHWRIRTGINQGDTALTTEVNLALALKNYGVDVDFETVWGQAHVEAERTGDSSVNFIEWVTGCCK